MHVNIFNELCWDSLMGASSGYITHIFKSSWALLSFRYMCGRTVERNVVSQDHGAT